MTVAIIAAGVVCVGFTLRSRWMFSAWGTFVFGAALAIVAVAFFGAVAASNEADRSVASTDIAGWWSLWLGVLGLLTAAIALGSWWLQQQRISQLERATDGKQLKGPRRKMGLLDWLVVLLLPIGGVVPFLGWFVVMMLLWTSQAWTHREKLAATLALPGGPLMAGLPIEVISSLHWNLLAKLPLFAAAMPLIFVPSVAAVFLAMSVRPRRSGWWRGQIDGLSEAPSSSSSP